MTSSPLGIAGDLINLTNTIPTSLIRGVGDIPNLTDALAFDTAAATKHYVVDYSTGRLVHTNALFFDVFISCIIFFALLLTLSIVVVQCRRTPRIPHGEFQLMTVGPVPVTVAVAKPTYGPPSYGTYPSSHTGYNQLTYGSINPPAYQPSPIHVTQPNPPELKMKINSSTNSARSQQPENTSTKDNPMVRSNDGKIEDGRVELNSTGNWAVYLGIQDTDSYSTAEETFHETQQMPGKVKGTELLHPVELGCIFASNTIYFDRDGCSSEEDIFFDATSMNDERELFNPKNVKAK